MRTPELASSGRAPFVSGGTGRGLAQFALTTLPPVHNLFLP